MDELFPDKPQPTLGLLNVLDLQRNYEEATDIATAYLAKQDNFQIRMMAAHFMAMSNDAKGAKRMLSTIRPQYLDLPYLRGVKARIGILEGRAALVVNDAKVAYLDKKNADNLRMYINTLDSAGEAASALPIIQQHVADYPSDAKSKIILAERTIPSNPAQALRYYEELLMQFPESPALLNNAAYLHFQANNMEQALEYSAKAYTADPANSAFADTYAQILVRDGRTSQAVEVYSLVITSTLQDEEVIVNYIETLFKNNNTLAAKRNIQQFNSAIKSQRAKDRVFKLQVEYLN